MNSGEYGVLFVLSTGFNMASYTGLSLTFTPPNGAPFTKVNPAVSISNTVHVTSDGLQSFQPNTYALYTFVNGDVVQPGVWGARLTYQDASPALLISAPVSFVVNP